MSAHSTKSRLTTVLAFLLTTAAIVLHSIRAAGAGPLWRDELNSVNLVSLETWSHIWEKLEFESFPLL